MTTTPFVQRIKRPGGRVDLYFRKDGYRAKLVSPDGSDALKAEVETHIARVDQIASAKTAKPGTIGGALRQYAKSSTFVVLAAGTRRDYERLIDELEAQMGDIPLCDVDEAFILGLQDLWASRGHRAANIRMQVLKNALKRVVKDKSIPRNPFADIEKVKRPHERGEAHPIWEDEEVEAAIALAIQRGLPGLARAIALGRWAGFRRGTICRIPLNARTTGYDEQGMPHQRLYWVTEKRAVLADKREDPRLTVLIRRTPDRALTIAYNDRNQPWKERALNQAVTRLLEALAKQGKARSNLTIHGLRHTRGVELALAGASDAEIMSQLEHATDRAAKFYRRQANRRKMADTAQDRVDNAISLRDYAKSKAAAGGG